MLVDPRSKVVHEHLSAAGIESQIRELPTSCRTAAEAASSLNCSVGAIASSLVFIVDEVPLLVMTSGRHRVDTDVLAAAVGASDVRMVTPQEVREVTGQAIGGVAPTGHPAPIKTVVDVALDEHDTIWVAAGTPRTVMPLNHVELLHLTSGSPASVAAPES